MASYAAFQLGIYLNGISGVKPELPVSHDDLEARAGAGDEHTQGANVTTQEVSTCCSACWRRPT